MKYWIGRKSMWNVISRMSRCTLFFNFKKYYFHTLHLRKRSRTKTSHGNIPLCIGLNIGKYFLKIGDERRNYFESWRTASITFVRFGICDPYTVLARQAILEYSIFNLYRQPFFISREFDLQQGNRASWSMKIFSVAAQPLRNSFEQHTSVSKNTVISDLK